VSEVAVCCVRRILQVWVPCLTFRPCLSEGQTAKNHGAVQQDRPKPATCSRTTPPCTAYATANQRPAANPVAVAR
jgi:hypothetical protein